MIKNKRRVVIMLSLLSLLVLALPDIAAYYLRSRAYHRVEAESKKTPLSAIAIQGGSSVSEVLAREPQKREVHGDYFVETYSFHGIFLEQRYYAVFENRAYSIYGDVVRSNETRLLFHYNQNLPIAITAGSPGETVDLDRLRPQTLSIADVEERVKANPKDAALLQAYVDMVRSELMGLARPRPDQAEDLLDELMNLVSRVNPESMDFYWDSFREMDQVIRSGRQQMLIGQQAAPVAELTWAYGIELKREDFRKVVLVNFWAAGSASCVSTLPKLRQWHETYRDRGLVVVGVTRYHNYRWDQDSRLPAKAGRTVENAEELELLRQFAHHHKLRYSLAVCQDGRLHDFYWVNRVPSTVLVDHQGKIRLIAIGTRPETLAQIDKMIQQLIAEM